MTTKKISLVVLSLGVCTLAMATDYKAPTIGFKEASPSHKITKTAEFNEDYKVEGAVKTDRQIASEKEPAEREPSSYAKDKKMVMHEVKEVDEDKSEDKADVKPWLYKNKLDDVR